MTPYSFRGLIYQLKRIYGSPIDVYHETSDSLNLTTGARAVTSTKFPILRAIVLPVEESSPRLLGSGMDAIWKRDGDVALADTVVFIDRVDLASIGTDNWYIIIKHKRYEILSVEDNEFVFRLKLRRLSGTRASEQVDVRFRQSVDVLPNQGVEVVHGP